MSLTINRRLYIHTLTTPLQHFNLDLRKINLVYTLTTLWKKHCTVPYGSPQQAYFSVPQVSFFFWDIQGRWYLIFLYTKERRWELSFSFCQQSVLFHAVFCCDICLETLVMLSSQNYLEACFSSLSLLLFFFFLSRTVLGLSSPVYSSGIPVDVNCL